MSEKAAAEFIGRLTLEPTLGQALTTAVASTTDRPEFLSLAAAFAAKRGYDVTADDLARYVIATDDAGQLADEALSKVAGGVGVISGGSASGYRSGVLNCVLNCTRPTGGKMCQ
jgi:hypothetical protein